MDEEILDTSTEDVTDEENTDVSDEEENTDTSGKENPDGSTGDSTGEGEDTTIEETPIEIQDSILLLIKKSLGIDRDYHAFNDDIIMSINTVLFSLNQIGVGVENFSIKDETALWSDFLGDSKSYEAVKSYIYLKVKLMFDPPSSSFVITALEKQASELEWRLNLTYETQLQDAGGEENGE